MSNSDGERCYEFEINDTGMRRGRAPQPRWTQNRSQSLFFGQVPISEDEKGDWTWRTLGFLSGNFAERPEDRTRFRYKKKPEEKE